MKNLEYIVTKMELIGNKLYALEGLISDIRIELEELEYLKVMLENSQEIN